MATARKNGDSLANARRSHDPGAGAIRPAFLYSVGTRLSSPLFRRAAGLNTPTLAIGPSRGKAFPIACGSPAKALPQTMGNNRNPWCVRLILAGCDVGTRVTIPWKRSTSTWWYATSAGDRRGHGGVRARDTGSVERLPEARDKL
jgi:hypothetical protein